MVRRKKEEGVSDLGKLVTYLRGTRLQTKITGCHMMVTIKLSQKMSTFSGS